MKAGDYAEFVRFERFDEDGVVTFEAYCSEEHCDFMGDGVVHYGDEEGAKKIAIGKILKNVKNAQEIDFEKESGCFPNKPLERNVGSCLGRERLEFLIRLCYPRSRRYAPAVAQSLTLG